MKFVVARYYFNSLFKEMANKSFIDDLKKEPFIDEGAFMYALGNFQFENINGYNFVRGTFGRIVKSENTKAYDKEKQEFIESEVTDQVKASIEFLIHHDTHLVFIEQASRITPDSFMGKFKKIYEHNSNHPASFEIDYVSDEKDIYKTIKTWDRVTDVIFKKLRPSNPDPSDTYDIIEGYLKDIGSDTADLSFKTANSKNSTKGINTDGLLVRQALALSSSGYGEAKLEGFKEGEFVHVGTRRTVRKVEVNFNEDGALESFVKVIEEVSHHQKK